MTRCLPGDAPTPPRFPAYRCDTPGRAGQPVPRSIWVRTQGVYQLLASTFTPAALQALLAAAPTRDARGTVAKMATEHVLELVRREVDPRLPSRLDCSFLYDRPELAALFRRDYQPEGVIYECAVAGWWVRAEGNKVNSNVFFDAPMTIPGLYAAIGQARGLAREYWTAEFMVPTFPELLVDGTATYVRELSNVPLPSNAAPPPRWIDEDS